VAGKERYEGGGEGSRGVIEESEALRTIDVACALNVAQIKAAMLVDKASIAPGEKFEAAKSGAMALARGQRGLSSSSCSSAKGSISSSSLASTTRRVISRGLCRSSPRGRARARLQTSPPRNKGETARYGAARSMCGRGPSSLPSTASSAAPLMSSTRAREGGRGRRGRASERSPWE